MTASTAVRAICSPKVGPIELAEKSSLCTPKSASSACSTSSTSPGLELRHRDLHDVVPSSGSLTSWIFASAYPSGSSV